MKHEAQVFLEGRSITLLMQGFPTATADGRTKYARLRIATGHTIDPEQWDAIQCQPKAAFSLADQFNLQRSIMEQVAKLNIARMKATGEGDATPDRVKEIFMELHGGPHKAVSAVAADPKLSDLVRDLERKASSALTAASYRAFLAKIEAFDNRIRVSQLTDAWRERFFDWIRANHKLKDNSMWGQSKLLNKAINTAKDHGMRVRIKTSHPFALSTPQTDYLDWNDLRKLVRYQPTTDRLQQIKTLALTMAMTSIRISDLWSFYRTLAERNGVYCGAFNTKKKCGKHHPYVMPIVLAPLADQIKKHGIPKKRSEDGIRVGMRELFDVAKIQKATIIGPHDLRRSFVTNMVGLGLPAHLLCGIFTGHVIGGRGELGVFFGYHQASLGKDQQTFVRLLHAVPIKDTAGLKLI